jgi:hypothetical protein
MPLAGRALLALWNDIRRDREAEYDRWHTVEHVPERVTVPGFLGARRYVDRSRDRHRYFTLYELAALDALESDEYRDLVANPTPWSASMRPDFANFVRAPCSIVTSDGDGIGGAIAVLGLTGAAPAIGMRDVLALQGVVAAHRARTAPAVARAAWQADAADSGRAFDALLLVEALDRPSAAHALRAIAPHAELEPRNDDYATAVYDLAFVFPGHRDDDRVRLRRAGGRGDA